ncbi:TPA: conjugal transfer protein [Clostridioides difficile]|uniref:Conjugal transfer protein n=14 Tax=Clostridioides difficile TaxID=1496 RepID=A0A9X8RG90_CLODI|nr:conjugal transfer protein [Clostridioides difficile]EQG64954.1 conjugative transposon TcpC family protein [Clostridioides difficile DA00149]MDU2622803.1 conjugal transfer protein [Streptococcus lutetiensis]AMM57580.1 conjugal transfer protein [Clostridioides difficile]AUA22240.1 conjugal transfer protein [Clostridioides difficile]AYC94109.1 conjugal transfer protein [Clostridioides difficile]
MFKKNKKQTENVKEKKVRTVKVGTHKKSVIALWVVLIASVSFGVYKNFTAIDMHTVHETETIQLRLTDTNGIENFVKNFAKSYYTWNNSKEAIEARTQAISGYLTKELQALNTDTIRKDIPVSSAVNGVQIWSVTQADENQFSVIFTVEQLITENGSTKTVRSAYEVTVYVDGSGNMVLTKNPTITSIPVKSGYTPKAKESDGTVDAVTTDEINEFLTTFFKLYPTATAKELSYYVNEGVLKPIGKDYVFSELVNPIYNRIDSQVTVSVAVKYLDQQTKATQVSQFDLVLEKSGSNWKIIK